MTKFVAIKSAAKELGLSVYYVRKRAREGSIPCIQSGQKFLINLPALAEQLSSEAAGKGVLSIGETN